MKQYKLISGDSHIVEPPRLWLDHMPAKLKNRAPKIVHLEIGDAWLMEGATAYYPFGLAVLPTTGVDAAIAGLHGVVLGRDPNGSMTLQPEDDRFWAACVEAKVNPSIHVNLAGVAPVAARGATLATPTEVMFSDIPCFGAFTTAMRSWPIPSRMAELV